ncbi:MAG TPA: thiamine phosphate synthase [Candidatus Limnocylindrales bacterium]|nr:thiamine phosphate synthase [Candidatus Limnocylindrales bacterium]
MKPPLRLPPLYPIVNVAGSGAAAIESGRALALELAEAGARIVQLRAKELGAAAFAALAADLGERLHRSACRLIVNDRVDVALIAAASGVHVGDEDLPVEAARRVLGPDAIIGYSTHSVAEMSAAARLDADYLAFGPVFESPTKAGVRAGRGIELLAQACRAAGARPVVAIGGITIDSAPACWRAGAASVAVISEIERSTDRRALLAAYSAAAAATA